MLRDNFPSLTVHQGFFASTSSTPPTSLNNPLAFFPGLGGGGGSFTALELRKAYFTESKRLHPDVSKLDKEAATKLFLEMTSAYEMLLDAGSGGGSGSREGGGDDFFMGENEEAEWRRTCDLWVGVSAELVEDLKADPAFREWLMMPEPDAEHWRLFLFSNGGLARFPLRPKLAGGADGGPLMLGKRRRKKKT